jgi:hypothetical protein
MNKDTSIQKFQFPNQSILYYTKISDHFDLSQLGNNQNISYYAIEYIQNNQKVLSTFWNQYELEYFLQHQKQLLKNSNQEKSMNDHPIFLLVHKDFIPAMEKYSVLNSHIFANTIKNFVQPRELISHNFMQDILDPNYTLVQKIENSESIYVFKTLDGILHSEPFLLFSHIRSQLDDANFFLDDFVEELSHRNDVAFLTYSGRFNHYNGKQATVLFTPLHGDEENIGGIIHDIEHHLEEGEEKPEEQETIYLIYYPKKEEIESLVNWDLHVDRNSFDYKKKQIFFVERHIVRNILGGEKFLKHPYIEEPVIVRKFKH